MKTKYLIAIVMAVMSMTTIIAQEPEAVQKPSKVKIELRENSRDSRPTLRDNDHKGVTRFRKQAMLKKHKDLSKPLNTTKLQQGKQRKEMMAKKRSLMNRRRIAR